MKPGMIRWNGVPLYAPHAQSARKFSVVLGTDSQKSSSFKSPWLVRSWNYQLRLHEDALMNVDVPKLPWHFMVEPEK